MSSYIELHAHSGFSFLDGASHPEELVLAAKELGYPALALTDHDGLYGAMEFARTAREAGIQPITGAEVTLRDCGLPGEEVQEGPAGEAHEAKRRGAKRPLRTVPPAPPPPATYRPDEPPGHFHVTLLAETPTGYANLCRLLTEAHRTSPRTEPALPLDSLLERPEGLILLTGCRRSPLLHALEDGFSTGEAFARRLLAAFGPGQLFVEFQENRVRGDAGRMRTLGRLADQLGLRVVATGNVHYHRRERHRLQDVLTAIRHRTTLDGSHGRRRPNSGFHLASPREAAARFASRPDAVANTLRIAERCAAFDLTEDLGYVFPDFQRGEQGRKERGGKGHGRRQDGRTQNESAMEVLTAVTRAALEERYPVGVGEGSRGRARRAEAERRLEEELVLVDRHGLGGFFLVYRDIMELAREVAMKVRGDSPRARAGLPPGRGRGSSVSSIICYLIGLSHVDPVEANLFLGRFLNDAVGSVPDIDLDFPRDIREELILAVHEKYGHDHTGLVAIFPTYRLRSAVREVGKTLDLPPGDLEKAAKLAEHRSAEGLRDDLASLPGFQDKIRTRPWQHFLERVEEIGGLPRHISQHVGGMIISSRPLLELVPLEPAAMEGRFLCQWDKDSCDDAGFIKIDFLALGMLSLVEEAVDLIAERGAKGEAAGSKGEAAGGEPGSPPLDLSRIDLNEEAVYDRICDGDTVGIFQVESRAQIQMLRRTRPRTLPELAVQVAIVRPGPIVGGAVNPYVRRREAQRADPSYQPPVDHPLLADALEETLGVIIYQDQVLQVCQALAGFSDGQAESLRRAMSRKRSTGGHAGPLGGLPGGSSGPGGGRGDGEARLPPGGRVLRVRIPQVPCGRLRPSRLPVRLAPAPLSHRVLRGAFQQPAHGLLLPGRPGPGCQALRDPPAFALREPERRTLHSRGRESSRRTWICPGMGRGDRRTGGPRAKGTGRLSGPGRLPPAHPGGPEAPRHRESRVGGRDGRLRPHSPGASLAGRSVAGAGGGGGQRPEPVPGTVR